MAIDQDGDRDVQPSKAHNQEGPRFVKQILLNNPKGVSSTPFSPLSQVPALWAAAPFHQASGAAHSQLGCTVALQCKRGADSSNLFIPVM